MTEPAIERAAVIALLRRGPRSWTQLAARILEEGSALTLLREPGGQATLFDDSGSILEQASADIEGWRAEGIGVHGILDYSYPELLRDIRERPPVLFSRGTLVADARAIAVVGSRAASDDGLRIAATIGTELVRCGVSVVSGLAAGVDAAAHRAALAADGRTVAIIGTGVSQHYPRQNHQLQDEIAERGLVLSQFWPDAPAATEHFPMRNAVMSGYCAATIVVEAGEHSGVRIQTRLALAHGRQVIVRRELLGLDWVRALANRPGVHMVRGLDDLLAAVETIFDQRELHLSDAGGLAGILG